MKFIIVAGARPNFMKVAPILRAFRSLGNGSAVSFVHTGQHYDPKMSDNFFDDLGLPPPDINLGIGSGTHAGQTGRIMIAFEEVCRRERPDWVIVVGDVNSTIACSLTAKKLGVRVAHVEAGLRSGDMSMPEEINRRCTDAIADLFFTTDALADANLRAEGVPAAKIHMVGNTMIDSLRQHIERARSQPLPSGLEARHFAVLTLHRPSNVDAKETLTPIMQAVGDIARRIPIAFPVHPRTAARLEQFGLRDSELTQNLRLMQPLSYLPFLGMIARCRFVLTDSGGIQEETTVLGVPCITMRAHTERPITCQIGTNVLVGSDMAALRRAAFQALDDSAAESCVPEKWDGHTAERIVGILLQTPAH
jgi:UDP-N-acetylglucosamine 2-epimerase (non-hydrolysing)